MHNIWQYPRACARAQERKYPPGRPYYRVLAWHCVFTRPVCSICLVVGGGLKTWRENADQKKETQEARCLGFRVVLPWHLCESDVRPGCPVCVTLFWNDREALRSACLPLDGPCTTPLVQRVLHPRVIGRKRRPAERAPQSTNTIPCLHYWLLDNILPTTSIYGKGTASCGSMCVDAVMPENLNKLMFFVISPLLCWRACNSYLRHTYIQIYFC